MKNLSELVSHNHQNTRDTGWGYNRLASLGPFLLPSSPSTPQAPLFPLTQTPRSGLPDCMSNMMGSTQVGLEWLAPFVQQWNEIMEMNRYVVECWVKVHEAHQEFSCKFYSSNSWTPTRVSWVLKKMQRSICDIFYNR